MAKLIAIMAVLGVSQLAAAAPAVTTCYTNVAILGRLDELENAVNKIGSVFTVHGRLNRMESDQEVSIRFLVSITAIDASRARDQTESQFVKQIIAMAGPANMRVETRFLGCKIDNLE